MDAGALRQNRIFKARFRDTYQENRSIRGARATTTNPASGLGRPFESSGHAPDREGIIAARPSTHGLPGTGAYMVTGWRVLLSVLTCEGAPRGDVLVVSYPDVLHSRRRRILRVFQHVGKDGNGVYRACRSRGAYYMWVARLCSSFLYI